MNLYFGRMFIEGGIKKLKCANDTRKHSICCKEWMFKKAVYKHAPAHFVLWKWEFGLSREI